MIKKRIKLRTLISVILIFFTFFNVMIIFIVSKFTLSHFYKSAITQELTRDISWIQSDFIKSSDSNYLIKNKNPALNIFIYDREENVLLFSTSDVNNYLDYFTNNIKNNQFVKKLEENEVYNMTKNDVLFLFSKIKKNGKECIIFSYYDISVMPDYSSVTLGFIIILSIIIFIAGLIFSSIMSKFISIPIENITELSKYIGTNKFKNKNVEDISLYKETDTLYNALNYSSDTIIKSNQIKRELLANVSHDLKTPLTMIKGYAEMIRDITGENKVKRDDNLDVIIKESDRLTEMVNEILILSKQENDVESNNYKISVFELNSLIEGIIKTYIPRGYDKNILYCPDKKIFVKSDENKISNVIRNLLNNAINYSKDEINIKIKQKEKYNSVKISIIDNGIGISNDKIPFIFERYYRGERVKRDTVGTGIGLSVIKDIFTGLNIKYGINSVVDKGTEIWFELPVAK